MNPRVPIIVRSTVLAVAALMVVPAAGGEEKPTPTPTPRPAGGKSLNDVAKEMELKGNKDGKAIVITNETVSENAGKGSLTTNTGTGSDTRQPVRRGINASGEVISVVDANDSSFDDTTQRNYWRGKYESELRRIEALRYQLDLLDSSIPGLWRDFYSRDDPAYRDGVIKPKLDAALERRASIEKSLSEAEPKLDQIKSDARKAGGEPGWFRGLAAPTPQGPTPTPDIVMD